MMRTSVVCVTVLVCSWISSCQNSSSYGIDESRYIAVQTELHGKWGMMAGDGNLVFSDEFKHEPSVVSDGVFSVQEGDYFAAYSVASRPKLIAGCDDLRSVGYYNDGIMPLAHENSRISFVDQSGNILATLNPFEDKEIVGCAPYANEGLLYIYNEDNKYGYCDKSGKIVIEPRFELANMFSSGVALIKNYEDGSLINIVIDKNGKEVFHLKNDIFPQSDCFKHGLLKVRNSDDTWGFIDKNGTFIKAKGNVKKIDDYNNESFIFMSNDYLWGVMSMNGDVLIRPKYAMLKYLPDGNYFVKADDKYLVLNNKGNKLQTVGDSEDIFPLNVGLLYYVEKVGSYYKFLNKDGKRVGDLNFAGIGSLERRTQDVTSDYFNYELVQNVLIGNLTDKGFDSYFINEPVKDLGIEDYEALLNKTTFIDSKATKTGWKFDTTVSVVTDEPIASWDYDGYEPRIVANSNARIERIVIKLHTSVDCWKKLKSNFLSDIPSKGYTLEKEAETSLTFAGNNCKLLLASTMSGEHITITIERNKVVNNEEQFERGKNQSVKTDKLSVYNAQFFRGSTGYKTTGSGIKYVTVVEGSGATPKANDNVTVHYTGRLLNGHVFDSSLNRNSPPTFPMESLIKGWREALRLMKVGGVAVVYIPSELAYGKEGVPSASIGPNADLIFELQLIGIE